MDSLTFGMDSPPDLIVRVKLSRVLLKPRNPLCEGCSGKLITHSGTGRFSDQFQSEQVITLLRNMQLFHG